MRRRCGMLAGAVLAVMVTAAWAADRTWQVRAAFVGVKPGDEGVAIFQLPDKTRIELPLSALTESDREAIRAASESKPEAVATAPVTVRGPLGKSVTLAVPEVLKAVETDAIWCSEAADAAVVYRLYLAGGSLSAAERSAAEQRLVEWQALAAEKRIRMGDDWVPPGQLAEARRKADEAIDHSLHMLKLGGLGNAGLFKEELEKASRLDPENGRAEFIMGLAYVFSGAPAKASEQFLAASRRDPEDPWVTSNLAISDLEAGRYGGLAARFRQILDLVPEAQLVADNLGVTIGNAAAARPKMPDRLLRELNELYRLAVQQLKFKTVENAGGRKLTYVTPYGNACSRGDVSTLPAVLETPREWVVGARVASGFVVAQGHVLTSQRVLVELGEIWVEDPSAPGRRLPAVEVASLGEPGIALLKCEGLTLPPLPLGESLSAPEAELVAGSRLLGPLSGDGAEVARGAVVTAPQPDIRGWFVHSAAVSRGLGGGPIVDATGRVVGLVAPTPRTDAIGNARGLGIPIERAWPLLQEQIPDLKPAKPEDPAPAWEAIEARVGPATVRVIGVEKRVKPKAD